MYERKFRLIRTNGKFRYTGNFAYVPILSFPNSPFKVIQPDSKTFQIKTGGKTETISVNKLKLAHIDIEHPDLVDNPQRPCNLHLHLQPHIKLQTPTIFYNHSTPVQDVKSNLHNDTPRFWREWCRGECIQTTQMNMLRTS